MTQTQLTSSETTVKRSGTVTRFNSLKQRMREFYETSETYKKLLDAHDENYLRHYVELVIRHAPPEFKDTRLRVWDRYLRTPTQRGGLRCRRYRHLAALPQRSTEMGKPEAPISRLRCYVELPFESRSFDVICSNELIEHLPDVETALTEMVRVVRPGGRIVLSGPNLCSPIIPLFDWLSLMSGKSGRPVWGETKQQALKQLTRNCGLYLKKRFFTKSPHFIYREPDLQADAIGGDADSAYYASPIDLAQFFRSNGLTIVKKAVGFGTKGRIIAGAFPYLSPYITMVIEK